MNEIKGCSQTCLVVAELTCHTFALQKKKQQKADTDEEFVPGQKANGNGRRRRRRHGDSSSDDDTESEDEFFQEDNDDSLHWTTPSSTENELDSEGSEYEALGRNAKRQAAIKSESS